MNKDYTSDIRQVERFMFDNSIYLLNMFQKKVTSFITSSSKTVRQNERAFLLNQKNNIQPSSFFQNPIKQLSRDLTKPIWNCVVKVQPKIIISPETSDQFQKENGIINNNRLLFGKMLRTFINRFKTQHQDQSNLVINLVEFDRNVVNKKIQQQNKQATQEQRQKNKPKSKPHAEYYQKNIKYTTQLLKLINQRIQGQFIMTTEKQNQEQYTLLRKLLETYTQILSLYFEESLQLKNQLDTFIFTVVEALNDILDSKCGSTLLTIQPNINMINLVLHPILIAIHNCLKLQINFTLQKQEKRKNDEKNVSSMKIQVEEDFKDKNFIYEDLKLMNISKIAFINLDGYESEANLQVIKYLSKYVMYVSFPKQSSNKKEDFQQSLKQFQSFKSERLLKMYFQSALSQSEKASLIKLHQADQKEMKKNMFIFPVHSKAFSQKYQLDSNTNIQFYESTFVKFMMEQIIMPQLRQFNPSLVILSYSGKIHIDNNYFAQLIKELTVASNFRFLFYPNQAKMFCFQERDPAIVQGEQILQLEQLYSEQFQKSVNILETKKESGLSIDFMDKLSIFLKISSGTFNLSKTIEDDSYIQKFKNYKVMRYSALLLKHLAKEYPSIQKLKMRANQYLTISKVLKNTYTNKTDTFDKLFGKVIPKYYIYLLKNVQKILFEQNQKQKNKEQKQKMEEQYIQEAQYAKIIKNINDKYDYVSKKQIWEDFKFQFCLQISTQKTQNRIYCHIPKFREKGNSFKIMPKKRSVDNLIAVQFQIIDQKTKQKINVQLSSNSQICYSRQRKNKEALIYVFNHTCSFKSDQFQNFYGIVNQLIDTKSQLRVSLKKVNIMRQKKLPTTKHLIEFNYFQSENLIFLFWPKIFDDIKDKLFRILGQNYIPESTLQIYRAHKAQPFNFRQLKPSNIDYNDIIPRSGCKCYQFQNSNIIYIFGGFYNDTNNYLKFQTDISFINYSTTTEEVIVKNLPKSFYFQLNQINNLSFVQKIKNDLVRPRIEYQIMETQTAENGDMQNPTKQLFLIGGVGQKFHRPYSLICYMAHKLIFNQKGQLLSIKRIKTNNLIPSNITNPTKIRNPRQMNIVNNAQNRNIYLNEGIATSDSYVVSFNKYYYDPNEERFDFQQEYEFAQYQKKTYREDITCLKKTPVQYPIKYQLVAKNCRGKQFYDNFITVSSENGKKYIFELQFQLPMEVRQIQINLPKIVRLTGASILAIDINSSMLYCLIKHPNFTLDKCVLAHFDINDLAGKLIDSKSVEVTLKQIHKFQDDVSKNIIVVANSTTVAILHGSKFNQDVELPQMILKRQRKNQIKTYSVKPCNQIYQTQLPKKSKLINEISTSLFLNQNNGVILCLSFKSIDRQIKQDIGLVQIVYVRIQQLNLAKDDYRWKKKHEQVYRFYINPNKRNVQGGVQNQKFRKDYFKILEIKSNKEKKDKNFFIKGIYQDQIYSGTMIMDHLYEVVQFQSLELSVDQYYKSIYRQNIKQQSIMLDKNPYFYQQLQEQSTELSRKKLEQEVIMQAQEDIQKFEQKDQQRIIKGKKQVQNNQMKE